MAENPYLQYVQQPQTPAAPENPYLQYVNGSQPGFLDRLGAAIRGNAAEQVPDVTSQAFADAAGYGPMAGLGQATTDLLGSDKDSAAYALAHAQGAKATQDANGNPMIEVGGKRFYVNEPGLSGKDAYRAFGTVAEFMPAAKLAAAAKTLLGGLTLGGLGAGGTEAAMEASMRGGEVDPKDVGLATAFGAGSELVKPILGAAGKAVSNLFTSDSAALSAGKKIADAAGLSGLSDDALTKLGRSAGEHAAGASPESLAAQAEYGLDLSRGQKVPKDFKQLSAEEAMRNSPANLGGSLLRDAAEGNQRKLGTAWSDLLDQIAGGQAPANVTEAVRSVAGSAAEQAQALKSRVGAAYDATKGKNAWVSGEPLADLQARAVGAANVVDEQLTPATVAALRDVGTTAQKGTLGLSDADLLRRRLSDLIGAAKNPTDARNVTKIKGQLDEWLDSTVDNAVMQGDQDALGALKNARQLRAEYGRRFQQEDRGGRLVQQMVEGGASPEELANVMLGASQVSNPAAASTVKAVKAAIGDDAEAWNNLRAAVLMKAGTKATGAASGPQELLSNIRTLLNSRSTLMGQLYTPEEISQLGRFSNALEQITPKGDFARTSGTTERLMRALSSSPLIGKLISNLTLPSQFLAGTRALSPVAGASNAFIPAGAQAAGQSFSME